MEKRKDEGLERIVDAAFDENGSCSSVADQSEFAKYRKMANALRTPMFDAPEPLIADAMGIFQQAGPRPTLARLLFSSLHPAHVRALGSDSFQMVFEAEEGRVRLMYSPENAGWEVVGQVEGQSWAVRHRDQDLRCDDAGRFAFFAKRLGDTGLTLRREESALRIPSAEEAATFGSSGSS